ncbi:MAG: pyridoxine 5'-phosphate synthase [Elusimicrobia bacterium RIFOXYB2_FULL_49_7]|nr:MAG: pyridoxine 5'-phosphate synthase [Elusimicrobia bacterium RIFOXYB2_FULL_49_7]
MATLSVNVDHIATLRQARRAADPDPVAAAALCEIAGADGITCHLREDRRHIQDRDLKLLRQTVKTRLNLEMAATEEMIKIALTHRPDMVTLVPEKRAELTTEGGLNVADLVAELEPAIRQLQEQKILVSLFIDPDLRQIKAAAKLRANHVELHTGEYANARGATKAEALMRIKDGAIASSKLGLGVNAGHGLDYWNTSFIAAIDVIEDLNIGFSIIARAALVGLETAVRDMVNLIKRK